MFDKTKVKSLSNLKDKAAKDITAEEITAVNTELNELGINGIEVSVAGTLTAEAEKATNLATELQTANESLETANASNEQLTADLAAANEKITELEGKLAKAPAVTKVETTVEADNIDSGKVDNAEDIEMTNAIREKHGL